MKSSKRNIIVSAIMVIALCFGVMVGGTYAWFTDTVSSNVCKVESGTLKVDLEMQKDDRTWVSAKGKTLMFKVKGEIPAEGTKILWEPGCTYELPALRVVNKGTLALKYKVVINGINGDAKLNKVIVWTIGANALTADVELLPGENKEFTISGHMLETAGNEYQGLSIDGIGITVLATQVSRESDSKDDTYDGNAKYPEIEPVIFKGGEHIVDFNSKADGDWGVIQAEDGAIVTIKGDVEAIESKDRYAMAVFAYGAGTIVKIEGGYFTQEITGSDKQYDLIYADGGAQIEITGGTFKIGGGDPKWTLNCKDDSGSVITVKGGTFYKFDPSAPREGQAEEVVVPEGYKVVRNGDWYTVVAE